MPACPECGLVLLSDRDFKLHEINGCNELPPPGN